MPLDNRKIHQYTETDRPATFSALLNLLAASTSNAMKYFSGTPSERAGLTPAPEGAYWTDTDAAGKVWIGKGGVWQSATGHAVSAYGSTPPPTQDPSRLQVRTGIASGITNGGGVLAYNFPYPFPTACIGVIYMPNQNKGAPALVENSVTKNGFESFYAGAAGAQRWIQYMAFGY